MRAVFPAHKVITIRLSCVEWIDGGQTLEDTLAVARLLKAAGIDLIDCSSGVGAAGEDALDQRIGFRVDGGTVQRIVAIENPQKTGGLLEGFVAQPGNFQQLFPPPERAVGVAMLDDIAGQCHV